MESYNSRKLTRVKKRYKADHVKFSKTHGLRGLSFGYRAMQS